MKRLIVVKKVVVRKQGNVEVPADRVESGEWTIDVSKPRAAGFLGLLGLLGAAGGQPHDRVAREAIAGLRSFRCDHSFIRAPGAPEGVLENGRYLSKTEDVPGTCQRRQYQATLHGFTGQELLLIHTELFGEL